METVAFTSTAERLDIIDRATFTLIGANFSITLANDRIGLVQTDFVSVSTVQRAIADSLAPHPDLENILIRVSVNADQRDETVFVQVKGTFQRIGGDVNPADNLIGLYWLEKLASKMASEVEAQFNHQLSDSTYSRLILESQSIPKEQKSPGLGGAIKVGGIIVAVLFAVTLAFGAFGPSSSGAPAQ